jgi:two-component system response regulator MtrA
MVNGLSPQFHTQMQAKVLIITDEPETARVWGFSLNQVGLDVQLIDVMDQPLRVWAEEVPDLIIIEDFNDEDEELELCRQLRAETVVPILYFTAKLGEAFQMEAYKVGADECISYPISPRLFQAKVIAWLRRTQSLPMVALDEVQASGFRLNPSQKCLLTPRGEELRLTVLESRLMYLLMSHPWVVFESESLVERVWGYYGSGDNNLLKNLVYRLRRKIELEPGQPRYLLTEGTRGYKFCPITARP